MVNNGARGQLALISKTSLEVDRAILDLNTVGTISLTKAILPHMIERRKGQIAVVSSLGGKFGKKISLQNILTQNVMKMLPNAKSGSSSNHMLRSSRPCTHSSTDHSFPQLTFSVPRVHHQHQFFPNNVRCASSREIL